MPKRCRVATLRRREPERFESVGEPMNSFDAAVYFVLIVAVVSGFNAGLLRSIATIMGYLAAMPVALTATPYVSPIFVDKINMPGVQNPLVFFGIFLVVG